MKGNDEVLKSRVERVKAGEPLRTVLGHKSSFKKKVRRVSAVHLTMDSGDLERYKKAKDAYERFWFGEWRNQEVRR